MATPVGTVCSIKYNTTFEVPSNQDQNVELEAILTTVHLPTLVSTEGHTFMGWYLSSNFESNTKVNVGETFSQHGLTQSGVINLYAKWIEKEYLIQGQTLFNLSDEIRELVEIENFLSPEEMRQTIENIPLQQTASYTPLTTEIIAVPKGMYTKGNVIINPVPYAEVENNYGTEIVIGVEV